MPDRTVERRSPLAAISAVVLLLGLALTVALTWSTAENYWHSEHRLLALQTRLTADAIAAADPLYVEDHLGGAANLAAATGGRVAVFRKAMSDSVGGKGPFAAASLWRVTGGTPHLVAAVGGRALLTPARAAALFRSLPKTFLVTELTGPRALRLGYGAPASGPDGTFVAFAEQPLPLNHRISVPAGSPIAQLNLALYLGRSQSDAALLDSTGPVPLGGRTYTTTIPFGDTMLTIVTSPRSPLAGAVPRILPWAIAAGGLIVTVLATLAAERLVRRRDAAARLTRQVTSLYIEQRSVAETLQHALLPQAIPTVPGVEIAVRYRAAAERADVGGDWYDVVPLDEDRFVFVVGDVSGHDLRAAAAMASLNYACRAYALEGHSPAEILSRLRRMLDVTRDGHLATVLCGLAEVAEHRVTLASAGHLPPLVVDGAEAAFPLVQPAAPIGIAQGGAPEHAVVTIPAGGLLVAYTDGLIERRNEHLDVGMKRLAGSVSRGADSLDGLLDRVITDLTGDGPADDVALIGVRWLT